MADFEEYQPSVVPTVLQGPNGQAWEQVHGQVKDIVANDARAATKAHFPVSAVEQGSVDALSLIGSSQERNLPRKLQPYISIDVAVGGVLGVYTFTYSVNGGAASAPVVSVNVPKWSYTFAGTGVIVSFLRADDSGPIAYAGNSTIDRTNTIVGGFTATVGGVPTPAITSTTLADSDIGYGERLREGWGTWARAGTPLSMLLAFEVLGYNALAGNPMIVTQNGQGYVLNPDTSLPVDQRLVHVSPYFIQWAFTHNPASNVQLVSTNDTILGQAPAWDPALFPGVTTPEPILITITSPGGVGVSTFDYRVGVTKPDGTFVFNSVIGATTALVYTDDFLDSIGLEFVFTSVVNNDYFVFSSPGGLGPNPVIGGNQPLNNNVFGFAGPETYWWVFRNGAPNLGPWPSTTNFGNDPYGVPYPVGIGPTGSSLDLYGNQWNNRFGVIFQQPLPPGWTSSYVAANNGTPTNTLSSSSSPSLDEVNTIRNTISTWKPGHAKCEWIKVWNSGLQWGQPGNKWGVGVWGGSGWELSPIVGNNVVVAY